MLPLPHLAYLMPFSHCLGDNYDGSGVSGFVLRVLERCIPSEPSQRDRRNRNADLFHSKVMTKRVPTSSRYWMDTSVSYVFLRLIVSRRDAHNATP